MKHRVALAGIVIFSFVSNTTHADDGLVAHWQLATDAKGSADAEHHAVNHHSSYGFTMWVAGYDNDVMAYIPSRRVLLEGGYADGGAMVDDGLPTVWAPQVEEHIVQRVRRQFNRTRSIVDGMNRTQYIADSPTTAVTGESLDRSSPCQNAFP